MKTPSAAYCILLIILYRDRSIEEAYNKGEQEANLLVKGKVYIIDLSMMQQINESTGFTRAVRRNAVNTAGMYKICK